MLVFSLLYKILYNINIPGSVCVVVLLSRSCPAWFDQLELSSILLFNLGHLLSSLSEAAVLLHINMLDAFGTCAFSDQPAGEEAAKLGNTITWGASDKEGCLFAWIPHLLVCMQDGSSWANAANFTSGQISRKRFKLCAAQQLGRFHQNKLVIIYMCDEQWCLKGCEPFRVLDIYQIKIMWTS